MNVSLRRRRELRRESTQAERLLWTHLRAYRLGGLKFRRQHPCGPFIVDFLCLERGLAIELDGGQHFDPAVEAYDARRTAYLRARGIVVLRFNNDVVFRELDGVLQAIAAAVGIQVPSF